MAWYARAQSLAQGEDPGAARQAFRRAKDEDLLRFRAPEVFNDIIREQAALLGANTVAVQQALADASRQGIIGNEVMLEDLHYLIQVIFLLIRLEIFMC